MCLHVFPRHRWFFSVSAMFSSRLPAPHIPSPAPPLPSCPLPTGCMYLHSLVAPSFSPLTPVTLCPPSFVNLPLPPLFPLSSRFPKRLGPAPSYVPVLILPPSLNRSSSTDTFLCNPQNLFSSMILLLFQWPPICPLFDVPSLPFPSVLVIFPPLWLLCHPFPFLTFFSLSIFSCTFQFHSVPYSLLSRNP